MRPLCHPCQVSVCTCLTSGAAAGAQLLNCNLANSNGLSKQASALLCVNVIKAGIAQALMQYKGVTC